MLSAVCLHVYFVLVGRLGTGDDKGRLLTIAIADFPAVQCICSIRYSVRSTVTRTPVTSSYGVTLIKASKSRKKNGLFLLEYIGEGIGFRKMFLFFISQYPRLLLRKLRKKRQKNPELALLSNRAPFPCLHNLI